jgi:hypothetical protein
VHRWKSLRAKCSSQGHVRAIEAIHEFDVRMSLQKSLLLDIIMISTNFPIFQGNYYVNGIFMQQKSILPAFLLKGKELTFTVKVFTKKKNFNGIIELFNFKFVYEI